MISVNIHGAAMHEGTGEAEVGLSKGSELILDISARVMSQFCALYYSGNLTSSTQAAFA